MGYKITHTGDFFMAKQSSIRNHRDRCIFMDKVCNVCLALMAFCIFLVLNAVIAGFYQPNNFENQTFCSFILISSALSGFFSVAALGAYLAK